MKTPDSWIVEYISIAQEAEEEEEEEEKEYVCPSEDQCWSTG